MSGQATQTPTQELTVELPGCWADLLDLEEIDMETARAGDRDEHANDAAEAFYDDTRTVSATFPDGVTVLTVFLCSGQSNYWASYDIRRDGDTLVESEPFHNLADGETWDEDGYKVTVKLV